MSELTFHCCHVEPVQAAVRKRGLRLRVKPPLTSAAQPLQVLRFPAFLSRAHVSPWIINHTIHTTFLAPEQGIVAQTLQRLPHLSARDPADASNAGCGAFGGFFSVLSSYSQNVLKYR